MALPLAERRELAQAHILGQAQIRARVQVIALALWGTLSGYDARDVPRWLERVLPVVTAAQMASVQLVDAFVARALEQTPAGLDALAIADDARNAPDAEVYRRPFHTFWWRMGQGDSFGQAQARARNQIGMLTTTDVQLAMRDALKDRVEPNDYERVIDAGACPLCEAADGDVYASGDEFPIHPHCGCGAMPLVAGDDRQPSQSVSVEQDGELGALLGTPAA